MNNLFRFILCVLVFVIPIFFLSNTFEAFDSAKLYLLSFSVSLLCGYLIFHKVFQKKELLLRPNTIDFLVILFTVFSALSYFWAGNKHDAFWGGLRHSNGLWALLVLACVYWLFRQVKGKEYRIINYVLGALFACLVIGYLSLFGIFQGLEFLPAIMRAGFLGAGQFNTTGGTHGTMALFAVALLPLLSFWTASVSTKDNKKALAGILGIISSLLFMFFTGVKAVWLVLIVSMVVCLGFGIKKGFFRKNNLSIYIPTIVLFVAVIIFFSQGLFTNPFQYSVLTDGNLGLVNSWKIVSTQMFKNPVAGLVGSGVGNFAHAYTKYKLDFPYLSTTRLESSGNYLAEIAITHGLLGLCLYLAIIGLILFNLFKRADNAFESYLFIALTGLFTSQILFPQNILMLFLFWVFVGIASASMFKKGIRIAANNTPLHVSVITIISLLLITNIFVTYRVFAADKMFLQAANTEDVGIKEELITSAIKNNPWEGFYNRSLAQIKWNELMRNEIEDRDEFLTRVNEVSFHINQGVIKEPTSLQALELKGAYFREIASMVPQGKEVAISTYERVAELDPLNPNPYLELSRIYLADNNTQKANEYVDKAMSLYPGGSVKLYKALVLEQQKRYQDSIDVLKEIIVNSQGSDITEVVYHLGRLNFKMEEYKEAQDIFNSVLEVYPEHVNSLFMLGNTYKELGDRDNALWYYYKALGINPENEEIKNAINLIE